MTGVEPGGAPEIASLVGTWSIQRFLSDDIAGLSGTMTGMLRVAQDSDGFAWVETGTLQWAGQLLPATRTMSLRRLQDAWWFVLPDGGLLYPYDLAEFDYQCGDDVYRGTATFSPDHLALTWTVVGPRKAQVIRTDYTRSSAATSLTRHKVGACMTES